MAGGDAPQPKGEPLEVDDAFSDFDGMLDAYKSGDSEAYYEEKKKRVFCLCCHPFLSPSLWLWFSPCNVGVVVGPVLLVAVYLLVVYSCTLLVSGSKACGGVFASIAP